MKNNSGFTLIEIILVTAVILVLAVALGLSFAGWIGKYRAESTVKDIYADLMDARQRAMMRNLAYFADFNLPAPPASMGNYRIIEDTNNNNVLYAAAPAIELGNTLLPTFPKTVNYAITWAGGNVTFDKKGIVQPSAFPLGATLCIFTDFNGDNVSDVDPDYDCIVISQTRINMGKITTQDTAGGACNAANCVTR